MPVASTSPSTSLTLIKRLRVLGECRAVAPGRTSSRDILEPHAGQASASETPVLKVLDLGLALLDGEAAEAAGELTTSGQLMGTLDYMAPEQANNTHALDIRADIYSLGCTLYKLLTGRPVAPATGIGRAFPEAH